MPSAQTLATIREAYGFDDPLPVRYVESLTRMAQGDLGYSFAKAEPVTERAAAFAAADVAADRDWPSWWRCSSPSRWRCGS